MALRSDIASASPTTQATHPDGIKSEVTEVPVTARAENSWTSRDEHRELRVNHSRSFPPSLPLQSMAL